MLKLDDFVKVATELESYNKAWQGIVHDAKDFGVPTTLSIKVADKEQLFRLLQINADNIGQIHIGTVNNRYIASAVPIEPYQKFSILKILERRLGSDDPLGLDSIDYLAQDMEKVYHSLKSKNLEVIKESNDMHSWLSLRFGNKQQFEAKFTDHLVLEVAIKELRTASGEISTQL